MNGNASLARWFGIAGLLGLAVGIVAGIVGLIDPSIYAPAPDIYAYSTSSAKTAVVLLALAMAGYTLSYVGYYLIGAVGGGLLGKAATVITVIASAGFAVGWLHGALSGGLSPLVNVAYLLLPGWILLTVAALQVKRVSTLKAIVPLASIVVVMVAEFGLPIGGMSTIVDMVGYGAITLVVASETWRSRAALAPGRS